MKKIILLIFLFLGAKNFAQTNGITYQAVILKPSGDQLPGVNNSNAFLVSKDICMVFKFIDEYSNVEYQEVIQTKTDEYGMVNLVIGTGSQTAGYADSFKSIVWNSLNKNLVVGINTDGNCSSYTEISNQPFSYVPLAFSALNAENVTGVVAIENGGTNSVTVSGAKTNLGLDNVNNTSDVNKPVSIATQAELNLKENLSNKSLNIASDGASDTKYPSVKSVKTYVDASLTSGSTALEAEVSRATAAEMANTAVISIEVTRATNVENGIAVNLVTETKSRTTADATLTTNLAAEVTNRTNTNLVKENLVNKSIDIITDGSSDTKYPSVKSVKNYVDASATSGSTAVRAEVSRATAAEIANATAITDETTRAINLENTFAVNLVTETNSRTTADETLTTNLSAEVINRTTADLLKANLASPIFTGTPSLPTGTIGVTQESGDETTALATTAFVSDAITTEGLKFVNLTTDQSIGGTKTFSSDMNVNSLTVGLGSGLSPNNTAVGKETLQANTTGFFNTAFGISSLYSNTDGARNTAIGSQALYHNNGYDNTALGYLTLQNNTTGSYNVGVGSEVLFNNTSGEYNTALGSSALNNNTDGGSNTAIGNGALAANISGSSNTASGQNSLPSNTTGTYNVAYGVQSLEQSTTADQNTAIGVAAIDRNTTGSSNTVLGAFAGRYISDGSTYNTLINNSVLIGAETKPNADNESNQIVIGYQAEGNGTNTIQLGNSDITNVKTSGSITAGTVTYPNADGTSGQVLTTNGSGITSWSTPSSSNSGTTLQVLSTSGRDALGVAESGHLIFNTTTNTFQGSKSIRSPYDYYTTTNYGFSEVRPGYSLTQTFAAGGQIISSAKIAIVNMGSGWAPNIGDFTFAIHDDVNNYNLFSTIITISGAGDITIPVNGYDWSVYPPVSSSLKLPVGTCSFVITSDSNSGGSADFLLNGQQGVGTTTNTYWESKGGTSAGYNNPDSSHPLSIALYPTAQSGIIWVDLSK